MHLFIYLYKNKMQDRKTLDLPRTDPGSDLYDLSDSDETNVRSATEMKSKSSDEETRFSGKENQQKIKSDLDLPLIVRPRSLSLGEEINSENLNKKNKRLRRRTMPRSELQSLLYFLKFVIKEILDV
jgi:hypothetical protein